MNRTQFITLCTVGIAAVSVLLGTVMYARAQVASGPPISESAFVNETDSSTGEIYYTKGNSYFYDINNSGVMGNATYSVSTSYDGLVDQDTILCTSGLCYVTYNDQYVGSTVFTSNLSLMDLIVEWDPVYTTAWLGLCENTIPGSSIYYSGFGTCNIIENDNNAFAFQWSGAGSSYVSGNAQGFIGYTSNVNINGPTTSLSANPSQVNSGNTSTLTWQASDNATSCTLSGGPLSSGQTSVTFTPGGTVTNSMYSGTYTTASLSTNETYSLTCSDSSGNSVPQTATVSVTAPPPAPPPSVTLTPTSQTIILGQSAFISSTVTATSPATISSCTLSSGGTSQTVTPNTPISEAPTQLGDTSYSMTCTDSNGNSATALSTITTVLPTFSFTAPTSPVRSNTSFNLQWNFTTPSGLTMRVPHPSLWQNMLATLGLEPAPAYAATSGDTFTCDLSWSTASSGISALWKNSSGVWSSWSSALSTQSVSVSYDGTTGVGSGVWPVKLTNTGTSQALVSFTLKNCFDTNHNTLPTQQPTVTVNPLNPVISNFSFSNTCSDPNLTLDVSSQGSVSCTVTGPSSFSQTYTGTPSSTFGPAISQTIPTSAQSGATYSVSCTNSGGSSGSQTATFSPTSTCTPASSSGGSTNFLQF